MRIALLNQYYAPDEAATAQMLSDLGSELARRGHDVVAVCGNRSYADPARRYLPTEIVDGVLVRRVATSGFGRSNAVGRLVDYAAFTLGSARHLLRINPDVIVSLTTPPFIGLVGSLAGRLRNARSILWSMDVYPDAAFELGALKRRSVAGLIARGISYAVHRLADVVAALGETMGKRLEAAGAREVAVIHNWADGGAIRPRAIQGHPLRGDLGWDGKFVVLYSGNLGLAHEFDTLLEAAARLRDQSDLFFAFVGGGPRLESVKRRAAELHLQNVEFRPYVKREGLGLSLTAADLHVVTLRPGIPGLLVPSKIYGILAAGRPVLYVGPPDGEVHDIVRESRCGTIIANGDVEALTLAILGYRERAWQVEEEGRRARTIFDASFTKETALAKWVELIESVGRRGARSPQM